MALAAQVRTLRTGADSSIRSGAALFGSGFSLRQVSIQLVLGNPFTAVELRDTTWDFRIDFVAILGQPTILLFSRR